MITELKNVRLALRLSEVSRWGIVAMARPQSVAEHSYRVAMLAGAIYHYMMGGTPHNSMEERDLISLSLYHDIFEVLSGDLDSIFKQALEREYPGAYNKVVLKMATTRGLGPLHDQVTKMERAAEGSAVKVLLKLADLTEALHYLKMYGVNSEENHRIRLDITARIEDRISMAAVNPNLRTYNWVRARDFIWELLEMRVDTPEEAPRASSSPGL